MHSPREQVDVEKFKVRHGEPQLAGDQTQTDAWDKNGLAMENPDAPDCLAKRVFDHGTRTARYFAKVGTAGPLAGRLVNPAEANDLGQPADWSSSGRYVFRPLTREGYDFYLRFLRTGNTNYLHQAEREMRDQ